MGPVCSYLVCLYVCVNVSMPTHALASSRHQLSSSIPLYFLKEGIYLTLGLTDWLYWLTSKYPGCLISDSTTWTAGLY